MATLDELIHYCNSKNPVGSLVLLGDSGCGKTYLVEKELQEALRDTHVVVRVSLFGINTIRSMHETVKKQWFNALLPICSKHNLNPEQLVIGKSFINAVDYVMKIVRPRSGSLRSMATDFIDDIVVLPAVEDIHTKKQKKIVLIFDDVDRSLLNQTELLGAINDYCENRHFNTIIIANRQNFIAMDQKTTDIVKFAREKTVAYTVYDHPNFAKIIHRLVTDSNWESDAYAAFLQEHVDTIIELFGSGDDVIGETYPPLAKCHNLRSLITALQSFNRIYYHMTNAGISDLEPYLTAFLPFYLAEKSGILRDGRTSFEYTDEELLSLYPSYNTENLFSSVRLWIRRGYWNSKQFTEELSRISPNVQISADAQISPDAAE